MNLKFLFAILLISFCTNSFAQRNSVPSDVSTWIIAKIPEADSSSGEKVIYSECRWHVYLENGKIKASTVSLGRGNPSTDIPDFLHDARKIQDQCFLKLKDGWLIGTDMGEFGGSLYWFSSDGKQSYKISDDQVKAFYTTKNGILAIEGLAHLFISEGKVIKIEEDSTGKWNSKEFVDLKASPEAVVQEKDGSLLIATTDRLVRVNLDGSIKILLDNAFWKHLCSPHSMVISDNGDIYIGMNQGIARINSNLKVEWLVPDKSFL